MESLIRSSYHLKEIFTTRNIYLLGIGTVVCGLSWSNVVMSIGQFIMLGSWFISGNYRDKLLRLYNNKIALLIISFFLLHLIGLVWTDDFEYGLKDIRIKLSLFVITFIVLSFKALTVKELKVVIHVFLTTLLFITFVSYAKLFGFTEDILLDKRELSVRISHIRYGLMIAFAAYCCFYFSRKSGEFKYHYLFSALYFFTTLVWFELYTGLLIFIIVGAIYLLNIIFFSTNFSRTIRVMAFIALLFTILIPSFIVYSVYNDFYHPQIEAKFDQDKLEKFSANGNLYYHATKEDLKENGIYVYRFIVIEELKNEWNKRSSLPFDGFDNKGQSLRETLFRYLSSKGLKKDSIGMQFLSKADIQAIENGKANVYYTLHSDLENRIFSTFYEIEMYKRYKKADGFSTAMRLEYWKTSVRIIKENFLLGVGTGDIQNYFVQEYQKKTSLLENEKYWRRSHNQFLSIWVQLGIFGFLLLAAILFLPFIKYREKEYFLYFTFLLIIFFSMLTEDTLETQAGITFFSIFNALFLSSSKS